MFFLILLVYNCEKKEIPETTVEVEKPSWLSAPHEELLEQEIYYVRSERAGEVYFEERRLDPRDIAIKTNVTDCQRKSGINIQKEDFRALAAKADPTITNLIGRSNGVENTVKDKDKIIDLWVEKYTQNGNKDPYCNFDIILNSEIKRIEIQPYMAKDPFIGKNGVANYADYLFRILDSQNKEMVLRIYISFTTNSELTKPVFYLIDSFWDHCPDPNLYELPMPKQEVY